MNLVRNVFRPSPTMVLSLVAVIGFYISIYLYQYSSLRVGRVEPTEVLRPTPPGDNTGGAGGRRTYINMVLVLQTGVVLTFILLPFAISTYRNRAVLNRLDHRVSYGQMIRDQLLARKNTANKTTSTFESRLLQRFPHLTANDLKICSLLRQNFSSKEIAEKLNITPGSVNTARYRLRRKLALPTDTNLIVYLNKLV